MALLAFSACVAAVVFRYYSFIFARVVDGRVVAISRVVSEVEGYVIGIRVSDGYVLTARTDDPKWALVSVGQCAQARLFPHPPWNLKDAGTYFHATLLLIHDCIDAKTDSVSASVAGSPPSTPPSSVAAPTVTTLSTSAVMPTNSPPGAPEPTHAMPSQGNDSSSVPPADIAPEGSQ